MAAHARLQIENTEGDKCHNLMSWLISYLWEDSQKHKMEWSMCNESSQTEVLSLFKPIDSGGCLVYFYLIVLYTSCINWKQWAHEQALNRQMQYSVASVLSQHCEETPGGNLLTCQTQAKLQTYLFLLLYLPPHWLLWFQRLVWSIPHPLCLLHLSFWS